jgi:hypothetical protein
MSKIPRTVLSSVVGVLALAALVALPACNAATPTATATEPDCEVNNTAKVTFENRSGTSKTYSVLWDGLTTATLGPGEKSGQKTVAAGIPHTLLFKVSNTGAVACNLSTPTPAQCSSHTYWCTN